MKLPIKKDSDRCGCLVIALSVLAPLCLTQCSRQVDGEVSTAADGAGEVDFGSVELRVFDQLSWQPIEDAIDSYQHEEAIPALARRAALQRFDAEIMVMAKQAVADLITEKQVGLERLEAASEDADLEAGVAKMLDPVDAEMVRLTMQRFAAEEAAIAVVRGFGKTLGSLLPEVDAETEVPVEMDGEGRFKFKRPKGDYCVVVASAKQYAIGEAPKEHHWCLKVPRSAESVSLSASNEVISYRSDNVVGRRIMALRHPQTFFPEYGQRSYQEFTKLKQAGIGGVSVEGLAELPAKGAALVEEIKQRQVTAAAAQAEKEKAMQDSEEAVRKRELARRQEVNAARAKKRSEDIGREIAELTTQDGQVFQNLKIAQFVPSGVVFSTSSGSRKVPFSNLPQQWTDDYFDEAAAAAEQASKEAKAQDLKAIADAGRDVNGVVLIVNRRKEYGLTGSVIRCEAGTIFVFEYYGVEVGEDCSIKIYPSRKRGTVGSVAMEVWALTPERAQAF